MPIDPNQESVVKPAFDPAQSFEPAAPAEKPAFDPNQSFEAVEKPAFDPAKPFEAADAPVFTRYEKITAGIGAELYTAPKQGAQFLDFIRTMFYKPVDLVLGTKISDGYANRMATREKEINVERGYAQEATGTGELAQLGTGVTQQLVQLPVQMAAGGAGLAVKGIRGAIAASSAFGGLQSAENTFATNVEKRVAAGEDIHDAANAEIIPSLTSGAITAAVTRGFGATGIESIFKTTGAKGVVNKFATVLREAGMEVAEEVTDETTQIMNDLINGQKMSPKDAFDRIKQTVFLSAVMGGTATTVHQFADTASPEAAIASELEATGAPKTAEVMKEDVATQTEVDRQAAIQRRADALNAALNPEVRDQQRAAAAQGNFVEGTFPEETAAPADIRLTTNQTPEGGYSHNLVIAPETTVEQLQEWEKKIDLSHLPAEAQTEVKTQIAAALKQRETVTPAVAAPAAAKPTVIPAEPSLAIQPQTTGEHVISTAINTPEGLLTGGTWNEPHEGIGIRHGLDEVPQAQRGFLVQDAEGNQRFVGGSEAGRTEAGKIAVAAGQTPGDGTNLQSSNLTKTATPLATAAQRGERTYNEAPQPTAAEVARLAARTPEEKAAQIETGTKQGVAEAEASGLAPTTSEAHKLTGDAAAGKKLRAQVEENLKAKYPEETLPEGTTELPSNPKVDKSPVTGDILRFAKDADGVVRPVYTNNPQNVAEHLDNGTRVVVPEELVKAKQINPAIKVEIDPKTGEYVATATDVKLPDGKMIHVDGPDQFADAYKTARVEQGKLNADIYRFTPEEMSALQEKLQKGAKERGLDLGPLEFDMQENPGNVEAPEGPSVEIPAEDVVGENSVERLSETVLDSAEVLRRINLLNKAAADNPLLTGLTGISKDLRMTPGARILAKLLIKSGADWSKVKLKIGNFPNANFAGLYSGGAEAERGTVKLNLAANHPGGIAATLLHEAVHHLTLRKLAANYKRTPFEEKAFQNIIAHAQRAIEEAYKREHQGKEGSHDELVEFAQAQGGDKNAQKKYREIDVLYGLSNIQEFVSETLSSIRFQDFLRSIEVKGTVRGKVKNLLDTIKQSLKEFFAGGPVTPGSLLDKAYDEAVKLIRNPSETERIGMGGLSSAEKPGKESRVDLEKAYTDKFGEGGPDLSVWTNDELRDAVNKPVEMIPGEVVKDTVPMDEDGLLGPDGKFHPAPMAEGGHYSASTHLIGNNPKLKAAWKKSGQGLNEDNLSEIYKFMEKQGFVRVVSEGGQPGTTTYISGKPTAAQKRVLIEQAKEQKVRLVWDKELNYQVGNNGEAVLYDPSQAFQRALPKPQLTHEIGPDGRVAHGITIPDEADIASLRDALTQIDKSNIPPVDKARLTADVNGVIETRESQENPVSLVDEDPNKFTQWINNTAKRIASNMKAEGDLPKNVFQRWLKREGEVKATSRDIAYTTRDFYKALRKVYKINKTEQFFKGFSEIPSDDIERMNQALLGKVSMDQLPEPLRGPLTEMRTQIDKLSKMLIDEGLAADDLAVKVTENLGTYLTRSYRIFDDPKWAEKIPEEVRNHAKSFLLSELRKDNPAATTEDAQRKMDAMLEDWRIQGDARFDRARGKLGSQDFSNFIARKDIAPELRALMGEYTDPVTNYARSITKMTNLIASNRFLKDVKEKGLGKFLYEDGTQPPGYTAQIAAEENDPMAPLNGLRTRPEIAEAFKEFGKAAEPGGWLFRHAMKVAAIAKGSKTVGSLMTQARNAEQFWFFGMNGHYNMAPLKEALASTGADIGFTDSPKWRQFYKNMLAMSVVDQSAKASELRDVMNDAALGSISRLSEPTKASAVKNTAANLYDSTIGAAVRMYQISDDVGKVVGFMNERKRQARLMGLTLQDPTDQNWKPNAADEKAAQVISLTYPTYSMVPKWIQQTRRQPFFGPFMTFSYEAMRTTYHNLSITADYLREAAKPGANPEYAKAAAQRLGGQIAVLGGLTTMVSLVTRAVLGLTADEEEDARKFLPEWDKNSQLAFVGKDKGQLQYVNMSYQNPYSYITDPVLAVTRMLGEKGDVMDAVLQGTKEFLQPFANEGVIAGALFDIVRNKTGTGRKVYNEADTADQKIRAVLARLFESVEPGTLTRTRKRFIPAARGETRFNQKLDLTQEISSEITGFKRQTLDYKQGLGFKGDDFVENERESERIFREVALREGTVQPEEISAAYERAEGQRFKIHKELHDIAVAAIRRGLSTHEVRTILKARHVAGEDITAVLQGRYRPFKLTAPMKTQLRVMLKRQLPPLVSPYASKRLTDSPAQQSKTAPVVEDSLK